MMHARDATVKPPEHLRGGFKGWQKLSIEEIDVSAEVIDFARDGPNNKCLKRCYPGELQVVSPEKSDFSPSQTGTKGFVSPLKAHEAYEFVNLPGLFLYPRLIPVDAQIEMLNNAIHRDLANPAHRTNVHFHHELPYESLASIPSIARPSSFFDLDASTKVQPKDPGQHKPITINQMLQKKLRWITLGGQYDWTNKVYPDEVPPFFPEDLHRSLTALFPDVDPQAAIVNFYTPGDILSMHRDVSEDCDRGLISISIGCDALFLVADQDGISTALIRLRSGDTILMSQEARFAWHGVPRVLANTCPEELSDWPFRPESGRYAQWKGWLASKRINLNVRQMREVHR